jgi:coenzyme F420 hydrogenase subunit beta
MSRNPNGTYSPTVLNLRCSYCRFCLAVCPGHSVDFRNLSSFFLEKPAENNSLGAYLSCYIGYSTNKEIRWKASSGGIVTALLIFALEEGIIDGALVTRMKRDRPFEPEAIIARTRDEILSAVGSKYCPVPVNEELKEILREDGRFAVVGLPCHIHGIRKTEALNKTVREKIVLHLGLFCSLCPNSLGTEFFIGENILDNITKLDYRGKGWPGGMSIELKNGKEIFVPLHEYISIVESPLFTPVRCMLCCDGTNELADISVGDAWLSELKDNKTGISVIIARSKVGEEILKRAKSKNLINIKKIHYHKVLQSQESILFSKKKRISARICVWRLLGKNTPRYNTNLANSSIMCYFDAILYFLITQISLTRRMLRSPLKHVILLVIYILNGYSVIRNRLYHHIFRV